MIPADELPWQGISILLWIGISAAMINAGVFEGAWPKLKSVATAFLITGTVMFVVRQLAGLVA